MPLPNYIPQAFQGSPTSWVRANETIIANPLGGTPLATMVRETAYNAGTNPIQTVPLDEVVFTLSDLTVQIPMVNPQTGAAILDVNGNPTYMTLAQIQQIVFSFELYVFALNDGANGA